MEDPSDCVAVGDVTVPVQCARVDMEDDHAVQRAQDCLQAGNVIALPTETIYGVAAAVTSEAPIAALYAVKERDPAKPVALCVGRLRDVAVYADVGPLPADLLGKLLPGPVTVVLHRTTALPVALNPGTPLIGVRMPDHAFCRTLATRCGAFALTSANKSNEASALCPDEFRKLWPDLGLIVDGGSLETPRLGSTVVDLSTRGEYHVIRRGQAAESTLATLHEFGLRPRQSAPTSDP